MRVRALERVAYSVVFVAMVLALLGQSHRHAMNSVQVNGRFVFLPRFI